MKHFKFLTVMLSALLIVMPTIAHDGESHISLNFAANVGELQALCGETYDGIGTDEASISFNDFRFYVSNVQLLTADGESVALELIQDGMWQYENVALLDFEDGTGGCSEIGNSALNGEINGDAPEGDYVGVRFDLGVPFELNHTDVTVAESPLNVAAMFWSWQGGYKFFRTDMVTDAEEDSAWLIHLGSTGCDSPSSAIAPQDPCARPNVTTVTFDEFDFENDVIVADLAGLLTDVALYENTLMPPGCMSGTEDPDCPSLFENFGLSLADGNCPDGDCSTQSLFRVSDIDSVTLVERSEMTMDMNTEGEAHDHSSHGEDDSEEAHEHHDSDEDGEEHNHDD